MILHIDMDAFYASVEQLDNPWLQGRCVIVGGSTKRGVVSAASYEARRKGIHSAMPIFKAKRKCPDGVYLSPRMARYKEVSDQVMTRLRTFSPLVEVVSIDEAFMDATGSLRLFGSPVDIGMAVKADIRDAVSLTCSVGIAPNKFLAKIASDMDKPDGLFVIEPEAVGGFVETLPIRKVPGVGRRTQALLDRLGIRKLGDVPTYPKELLLRRLGKFGHRLIDLSHGIDRSVVTPSRPHKSVSSEHTLNDDTDDIQRLKSLLLAQAEEVARQLRKLGVKARTVTLKIKHADFQLVTRSSTLAAPSRSSDSLYKEAAHLLDRYGPNREVRLIGVGASGFVDSRLPRQMDLFAESCGADHNWEKVDQALDTISARFGRDVVRRATVKDSP